MLSELVALETKTQIAGVTNIADATGIDVVVIITLLFTEGLHRILLKIEYSKNRVVSNIIFRVLFGRSPVFE